MCFHDFKGSSHQLVLIFGQMNGKAQKIIGYMRAQMMKVSGDFPIKCGDGLDGMTVLMSCSQIKLKLVGIMYQIVALT